MQFPFEVMTAMSIDRQPANDRSIPQQLEECRDEIDQIDREIMQLLGFRFEVAQQVAVIKQQHNIPIHIADRIEQVTQQALSLATEYNVPPSLVKTIWPQIIHATCDFENQVQEAQGSLPEA